MYESILKYYLANGKTNPDEITKCRELEKKMIPLKSEVDINKYNQALIECFSSVFNIDELGSILAVLSSNIENKIIKYISFPFRGLVDIEKLGKKATYNSFSGDITFMPFAKENEMFLSGGFQPLPKEKITNFYEPVSSYYYKNIKKELYLNIINFGNKLYLTEFIECLIDYRRRNNGKILSKGEIWDLMSEYISKYNQGHSLSRKITLGLNR